MMYAKVMNLRPFMKATWSVCQYSPALLLPVLGSLIAAAAIAPELTLVVSDVSDHPS
jgi:hypothetical protein